MGKATKKEKAPLTSEKIFKIMMTTVFVVAGAFLLKNVIGKAWSGAVAIGICLAVFATTMFLMKKLQVKLYTKQLALCVALPLLVFFISIFSGNFYSDDFPLFLAVLGISGIFLEPMYTKIQMIECTVLLALLYVINPGKADPLSQFIMCTVLFAVAAWTFSLVIERGRAFIELSQKKAEEAERLLQSIQEIGEELEKNYEASTDRINGMREVNARLEMNTGELTKGSLEISSDTEEVDRSCDEVYGYIQVTGTQIDTLNKEVRRVESEMSKNKDNMHTVDEQMQSVKETIGVTKEVFDELHTQIDEISEAAKKLTGIAANTKLLALNASIEAARAGEAGAGFSVVASQVQSLAVDSNECSAQVISVVENIKQRIELSTEQLGESVAAIEQSADALLELEKGFEKLITKFSALYENIEAQNVNVKNVEQIFGSLRGKVDEMNTSSNENRTTVDSIVDELFEYKEHINQIVEDTKKLHELSATILSLSTEEGKAE